MIFTKKQPIPSKIYEELGVLGAKIARLEATIDGLEMKIKSINGRINRGMRDSEDNESVKYSDPFDSIRKNGTF